MDPDDGVERPTLASVAALAQVSKQTVSNVLNAPHLVSEGTLDRVRAVIDEVGYRPLRAAQQMRSHRSQLIGMRIEPVREGIGGIVLDQFLHALTRSAEESGHRLVLFTADDAETEVGAYDELVASFAVDAFVLTGTSHRDPRTDWLRRRRLPVASFGRPWDDPAGRSWVDIDGAAGTRAAVEHLVDQGHTRIAFLGWPAGSGTGDDRRAGWVDAMSSAGLPVAGLDAGLPDDPAVAQAAALGLVAARGVTALVCASDSLALGALGAVQELGRRPGTDVAVVGFDDTPVAAAIGLSSVAQPVAAAAAACIQLLRAQLDPGPGSTAGGVADEPVLLAPRLVVRASSDRAGGAVPTASPPVLPRP
jgi:DNA-binding LacI/PurR family transcriptional regulator